MSPTSVRTGQRALRSVELPAIVKVFRDRGLLARELEAGTDLLARWQVRCPNGQLHENEDQNPSAALSISAKGQALFYCSSCDQTLDRREVWRAVNLALGNPPSTAWGNRGGGRSSYSFDTAKIAKRHEALLNDDEMLEVLAGDEITLDALTALEVGLVGQRITIAEHDQNRKPLGQARYMPSALRSSTDQKVTTSPGQRRGMAFRPGGPQGTELWICEGPSDALALMSMGLEPVSAPAVKIWRQRWVQLFNADHTVYVVADCDGVGRSHGRAVADSLVSRVRSVAVVDLGLDLPRGYDAGDLLRDHGPSEGRAVLLQSAEDARPLVRPRRGRPSKQEDAEGFLLNELREGPQPSTDVISRGKVNGFSERLLRACWKRMGVSSNRDDTTCPHRWLLSLPPEGR